MSVTPVGKVEPRNIVATKFVYRDPKLIPPRETLYAGHFMRGFMSLTIGIGGGGKSNLEIVDSLAMMSGAPLLGHSSGKKLKVWYINLEDPRLSPSDDLLQPHYITRFRLRCWTNISSWTRDANKSS
jgi:hypothetical protein